MVFFGIHYIRYATDIKEVKKTVRDEVEGPGQLLGYHAVHKISENGTI